MPWSVQYLADLHVVETRYAGQVSPAELEAAVRETMRVAGGQGCNRLLADLVALTGGHSSVDLFYVAREVTGGGGALGVREALLLPLSPEVRRDAHFWADAATNRGMVVRGFDDRAKALAWLTAPGTLSPQPAA